MQYIPFFLTANDKLSFSTDTAIIIHNLRAAYCFQKLLITQHLL